MSVVLGYKFDNEFYADTEAGEQSLLEAVSTAHDTEAASHGEDVAAASEMLFQNTSRNFMTFWQNCQAINSDAWYPMNIERVTDESDPAMIAECKEWLYMD